MRRSWLTLVVTVGCLFGLASAAHAAGPTAVATDSDGVVYAGFENGGQIERYSGSDGSFLGAWGTPGSAAGQIGGVVALDVAPTGSGGNAGNVWVLDTNRRVQEFSRTGTFIRGFQLTACAAGVVTNPRTRGGLDVAMNDIYVAHPCRNQVLRFNRTTLAQQTAVSVANQPKGISAQLYGSAPGSAQAVYVARSGTNLVSKLNLTTLASLGTQTTQANPADVFVDAFGVLFVSLTNDDPNAGERIYMYDANGTEFRWLGGPGTDPGRVIDPVAFDVYEQFSDLAGNVFVADYGNARLQRWNSFGFTFWAVPADDSAAPPGNPPQNTTPPQIQGTAVEGNTVTCTQGTWTENPTSFAFQWRRNGSNIPGATTNQYTIDSADVGQNLVCRVTATNANGSTSASSDAVVPAGAPTPDTVGITVNNAAVFTDSPNVTLTIHEPAGATNVHISNDGGFARPDTRAIAGSDTYNWTLVSSGADRLPKSVYVRFTGPGIDDTQTYSDDIILDQAPPAAFSATMEPSSSRAKARWVLKVRAKDDNSGLSELRTSRSRDGGYSSQPFANRTAVKNPRSVQYVRVTDRAGNVAKAIKVKRKH